MKKALMIFGFLMCVGVSARAAGAAGRNITPTANIGPATSASNVTISAGATGVRNCITDIDVVSNSTYTLRVLDGATTTYALLLPSGTVFARTWDLADPFCGTAATLLKISVDNGTFTINYRGITY